MPDWKEAIRQRLAAAELDSASEIEVVEELTQHLEERYRELQLRSKYILNREPNIRVICICCSIHIYWKAKYTDAAL